MNTKAAWADTITKGTKDQNWKMYKYLAQFKGPNNNLKVTLSKDL